MNLFKINVIVCCFLLMGTVYSNGRSLEELEYLELKKFSLPIKNTILELWTPPELDNTFAKIAFNIDGELHSHLLILSVGQQLYELRYLPFWGGTLNNLTIKTLPGTQTVRVIAIKKPNFQEELSIFMTPKPIIGSMINKLAPVYLWGNSWNTLLMMVFGLLTILFLMKKKKLRLSLLFGFFLTWTLMDLRQTYDHATVVARTDGKWMQPRYYLIQDYVNFLNRVNTFLASQSWGLENIIYMPYNAKVAQYKLSDHLYIPLEKNQVSDRVAGHIKLGRTIPPGLRPDYILTSEPGERTIVLSQPPFYLVERAS